MFPYSNIKSPRGYAAEAEAAAEAPRNELNRPLPYPRLFKFRTVSANSDHAGDDEEGDSGSGSGSNSNSNSAMADVAHLSFFLLLSISSLISVAGLEFHVGGPRGWVVPAAVDDPEYYNRWAMRERFHVGDSLYFKYKNDSVVVVDREACGKCSAADPLVFFDNGNTTFRFDRYGFFYFISGSQGHCEAGQRLIVRVMVHPATSGVSGSPVPAPATGGSSSSRSGSDSGFDSGPAKSGSPLAIHAGLGFSLATEHYKFQRSRRPPSASFAAELTLPLSSRAYAASLPSTAPPFSQEEKLSAADMPSLLSDPFSSEELKRSNDKKAKEQSSPLEQENSGKKKSKKSKKRKTDEDDKSDIAFNSSPEVPIKKKKKPEANGPAVKKLKDEETDEPESGSSVDDPNALSNFRISKTLVETLNSRGIKALFPIQAMTFDLILDGFDLVGRARTGQGKTLAFVLPILESLINGRIKASRKTGYGRPPSVLVLLPTRELAIQVHSDFEVYGGAVGLSSCCVYGGAPFRAQELSIKRGVDIIVGTPGRVKDHLERGTLDLRALNFRVLDEADEMLRMGFVEDVELILGKVEDASKVQTLLFSATLPDWVKEISARFLKEDKKTADLVCNEKLKASDTVRHLALPCLKSIRHQILPDIIRCYSRGGRTIIFTETKESASELAGLLPGSRALHGDVMQQQREVILTGFRSGKFLVLVATNVAARGLDINDVQLIIQCEPPRDVEAYIHRSGRTGRAGNTGVAILLYEPKYKFSVSRIERESGVKFEPISAPQPADIAESVGSEAANAISSVSNSVIPVFRSHAEQLLSSSGLPAVDLLAKALAKAAGFLDIKRRSLLSSLENYVTLLLQTGNTIYSPSFVFSVLGRYLPEEKIQNLESVSITADSYGVVFDVPADDVDEFLEVQDKAGTFTIEVLETLPPLQDRYHKGPNSGRGRFTRGGGGFYGGGFSGGRGGGNRFSGGNRGGRGRGGGGRNSFFQRN